MEPAAVFEPVAVVRVAATDQLIVGQQLTYSIVAGNVGGQFSINATSGQIRTATLIDYESQPHVFNLTVQASTSAPPGGTELSSQTSVTVTVNDLNDFAPVFAFSNMFGTDDHYRSVVHEDQLPNTPVMSITATDADAGLNSDVVYSLEGSDKFKVDRTTGVTSVKSPLNRDSQNYFLMQVAATDQPTSGPANAGTGFWAVDIINDVSPLPALHLYRMSFFPARARGSIPVS